MNKKVSIGLLIALMCITAAVTISVTMVFSRRIFNQKVHNINEREAMYSKIAEIDGIVRQHYIGTIDENKLMDSLSSAFISGIGDDKNGKYITSKKYKELQDIADGKIVGIGATTEKDTTGYMKVVNVYDIVTSGEQKLLKGDLIIKVGDVDVTADNYEDCVSALSGEPGTTAKLVVRRNTQDIPIEITRGYVEIPVVFSKQIGQIGYIKITGFNESTVSQFNKTLKLLLKNNVSGLIFDVRNNPGGTINSVCAILEPFLPKEHIVMMTNKDGVSQKMNYKGSDKIHLPTVTIINGKSASAAELFAQVLRDYERTKIVGVTSFGKGTMQQIFKLKDGSVIDLTSAKFQTPKSPNFDGIGVKPDFEVRLTQEQESALESLDENTDPQLKKSVEFLRTSSPQ